MKKTSYGTLLSAGDLSGYISCHHLTHLNLAVTDGRLDAANYRDPLLAVLQERGLEFETGYLRRLEAEGWNVVLPELGMDELSVQRTREAMEQGAEVIYQASLRSDPWQGRADFLIKVYKPSRLGDWSYEVFDAKLARETRAGTILQLCLYAELLADIQGVVPEYVHVITPEEDFTQHSYRSDDFMAYFRLIRAKVLAIVAKHEVPIPTYPDPCAHCGICGWWSYCDRQRRSDDHLSLVAGLSGAQAVELRRWDIRTLTALAGMPLPLPFKPSRGAIETFIRLREQARVQLAGRTAGKPGYELLDIAEGKGLSSLPEPSPGDLFFDMEGDPFIGSAGMEYLFGWVTNDEPVTTRQLWALNPEQEKAAFEAFVDEVTQRCFYFPDMHIYHFSPYEPSALKRLMGRYATREDEVDTLLRAGRFVDLHTITRQAIRAGVESYSLKELEQLHDFEREFELRAAAAQLREMERRLERNDIAGIAAETKAAIEQYNYEDCRST
ncbi:MAG TPA: TM0106 family RecB-like putative nuclease, partial [Puia sp.]|nr:TM0106 family RecB-like putative nuclease [Puia sp.]